MGVESISIEEEGRLEILMRGNIHVGGLRYRCRKLCSGERGR